uniref:Uncharacterized protein LOC102806104 n=1 Tax=Saccoglossus kowalevskii TaxID=10224 RepID=A0ABM0MLB9_SACKO|nr:PREDICTED: uncharacterized protein LOC102806104 [Saccoglossus kowalevskii]
MVSYKVTVVTKTSVHSAFGSPIYIQLIGNEDSSDVTILKPGDDVPVDPDNYALFQAGQTDVFDIDTKSIDEINQIKIGFCETGFVDGWSPHYIAIENSSTNKNSYYVHDGDFRKWKGGILTLSVSNNAPPDPQGAINIIMGPILGCRALSIENEYEVCVLIVTSKNEATLPPVTFTYVTADQSKSSNGRSCDAIVIAESKDKTQALRLERSMGQHSGTCTYTLPDGRSFDCCIQSQRSAPRFTFGSCAGLTADDEIKDHPNRNIMWLHMRNEHESQPVHLMVMAGDQVYADSVITQCPSLVKWSNLSREERETAPLTDEMKDEIDEYFFNLYCTRWREPEPAWMYARVPSIMMFREPDDVMGPKSDKKKSANKGNKEDGTIHGTNSSLGGFSGSPPRKEKSASLEGEEVSLELVYSLLKELMKKTDKHYEKVQKIQMKLNEVEERR